MGFFYLPVIGYEREVLFACAVDTRGSYSPSENPCGFLSFESDLFLSFFLSYLKSLEEFVLNILPGSQTPTYVFQFFPVVPCQ